MSFLSLAQVPEYPMTFAHECGDLLILETLSLDDVDDVVNRNYTVQYQGRDVNLVDIDVIESLSSDVVTIQGVHHEVFYTDGFYVQLPMGDTDLVGSAYLGPNTIIDEKGKPNFYPLIVNR